MMTITTWTDGVRALLPRTHRIAIGKLESPDAIAMVPWSDVIELAGELLSPVADLYPPRWEVTSFPDDATLERLRQRALAAGAKPPTSSGASDAARPRPSRGSAGVWFFVAVAAIIVLVYALSR
jgi:hypothetical protein